MPPVITSPPPSSPLANPNPTYHPHRIRNPPSPFRFAVKITSFSSLYLFVSMGCSRSKLEPDEEGPPAELRPGRRIFHDYRRRRDGRGRKDSSVTTSDLLRPDVSDAGEVPDAEAKDMGVGEADKRGLELGLAFRKGKKGTEGEEEELPGSPSFRFYFVDLPTKLGDGDHSALGEEKNGKLEKTEGKDNSHQQEDSAKSLQPSEDSEGKQQKREKGWRFKVLTKRSSDAYNSLATRQ
ncbi:uncharacterized protein [Typha latifolia]|uniref:uncharacterized protein n=1 Tax=Typha latifolia TaxID=4733 RepID=UPI003C2F8A3D